MNLTKEFFALLRKEILLEWRQRYALGGILLYVLSTVFIVYTAFIQVQPQVWNTLFWMVMLFAAVNAVAKSFVHENSGRQLYYYTLANPLSVIFSKIVYNGGLLSLIGLLSFLAFSLVAGNPVRQPGLFFGALLMGAFSLAVTFTFISAIASKSNNGATLMAILSFPLVIPVLMTLIKITANALGLIQDTSVDKDFLILLSIDLLLLAIAMILFPFLWRD